MSLSARIPMVENLSIHFLPWIKFIMLQCQCLIQLIGWLTLSVCWTMILLHNKSRLWNAGRSLLYPLVSSPIQDPSPQFYIRSLRQWSTRTLMWPSGSTREELRRGEALRSLSFLGPRSASMDMVSTSKDSSRKIQRSVPGTKIRSEAAWAPSLPMRLLM